MINFHVSCSFNLVQLSSWLTNFQRICASLWAKCGYYKNVKLCEIAKIPTRVLLSAQVCQILPYFTPNTRCPETPAC